MSSVTHNCGWAQQTLVGLHAQNRGHEIWGDYFFTNSQAPRPFTVRGDVPDDAIRCKKCGHTIDEHRDEGAHSAATRTTPQQQKVEHTRVFVSEVDTGKGWYQMSGQLVSPRLKDLFVTKAMKDVCRKVKDALSVETLAVAGLLLCGNPGVGKSVCLDFLLHDLVSVENIDIILLIREVGFCDVYVTSINKSNPDKTCHKLDGNRFALSDVHRVLSSYRQWIVVLHECHDSLPYQSAFIVGLFSDVPKAYCILASSPSEVHYKRFEKDMAPSRFFISAMELNEAVEALQTLSPALSQEIIETRFEVVGGIFRHLISDTSVENAKHDMLLEAKKFNYNTIETMHTSLSSKLVLLVPTPNCSQVAFIEFVSFYARNLVLSYASKNQTASAKEAYYKARMEDKTTPSVLGQKFELFVIALLRDGEDKLCRVVVKPEKARHDSAKKEPASPNPKPLRRLPTNSSGNRRSVGRPEVAPETVLTGRKLWELPTLHIMHFHGQKGEFKKHENKSVLYLPFVTNFPLIDLAIAHDNTLSLVQVTIAHEHRPTLAQWITLYTDLKPVWNEFNTIELVWVVPHGAAFGWQSLEVKDNGLHTDDVKEAVKEFAKMHQFVCHVDVGLQRLWVRQAGTNTPPVTVVLEADVGRTEAAHKDAVTKAILNQVCSSVKRVETAHIPARNSPGTAVVYSCVTATARPYKSSAELTLTPNRSAYRV